jgi:hypothetical protein
MSVRFVIPAKAGIQGKGQWRLDSGLRWNDGSEARTVGCFCNARSWPARSTLPVPLRDRQPTDWALSLSWESLGEEGLSPLVSKGFQGGVARSAGVVGLGLQRLEHNALVHGSIGATLIQRRLPCCLAVIRRNWAHDRRRFRPAERRTGVPARRAEKRRGVLPRWTAKGKGTRA